MHSLSFIHLILFNDSLLYPQNQYLLHEQTILHLPRPTVSRRWRSPEGYKLVFRYVADAAGYRVLGDALPTDTDGVAAGGQQVAPPAEGFVLS